MAYDNANQYLNDPERPYMSREEATKRYVVDDVIGECPGLTSREMKKRVRKIKRLIKRINKKRLNDRLKGSVHES